MMNATELKSQVCKLARRFERENRMSLSEAMRLAWQNLKLKVAMGCRCVRFTFTKKSGEVRNAFGTLLQGVLPEGKNSGRKQSENAQVYYDIEVQGYRSFVKANLLSVEL